MWHRSPFTLWGTSVSSCNVWQNGERCRWRPTWPPPCRSAEVACRGHAEDTHNESCDHQSRHDSAGSLPTSFIKLKSPKGAHYFQYHEVIIWFSNNTGGHKFSKVFMFLDVTQQNNQKKLRWANTFVIILTVIILTESTLTVPCDNLKPNMK